MMKFLSLFFLVACATGFKVEEHEAGGPIAKVLGLLDDMYAKITKEGEDSHENFEEFSKFCASSSQEYGHEIKDAKKDVERAQATIDKSTADAEVAAATIEELTGKIAGADKELAAAKALRADQKADFEAADKDLGNTIDMLSRAHRVLKRSMGGSFMQAAAKEVTSILGQVIQSSFIALNDKQVLTNLMQQGDDAYESKSGGILETLRGLKDEATASRNELQKQEMNDAHASAVTAQGLNNSITNYNEDLASNKKAKAAAEESLGVAQGELSAAQKELASNTQSLEDLRRECMTTASEFETEVAARNEELEVLTKAKDILKQGFSKGFFFQVSAHVQRIMPNTQQEKAATYLKNLAEKLNSTALYQVAETVGADVFGKVKGMIHDMIEKLTEEQAAEASKEQWCNETLGKTRKQLGSKQSQAERLQTKIDKAAADSNRLTISVKKLTGELAAMSSLEKEAIALRRKQKTEYQAIKAELEQSLEAVNGAIKVLRDYYSAKKDASGSGASAGIIGLLETAESDFSRNLAEANANESEQQGEFDKMLQNNKVSRATKSTDVEGKKAEINRLGKAKNANTSDLTAVQSEIDSIDKSLGEVTKQCTRKVETFEERQAKRKAKIEGLKTALQILEEEAASFLQLKRF